MSEFTATLLFSLSITGPIFIVLLLGTFLGRRQFIDQAFIETGSKLVFNVTLPTLLFINISQSSFDQSANFSLIATGLAVTLLTWLLIEGIAYQFIEIRRDRGVVVQGGFRSNMGIFGLAYCFNAYGNPGLVTASLYLAAVTILFNILSIISLNRSLNKNIGFRKTLLGIFKNPLIIAIVLALPFSYFNIQLPAFSLKAGEYFANMTLPLALLCIGASLDFSAMRHDLHQALVACSAKLVLVPVVMMTIAIALGFRGMELGILLLMSSAPTAAASYVMVKALGGNASLAANIIVLSTLGSLFTTSAAMMLLNQFSLI
ncbi:MAG: putative malonate transporter [Osedax symbiont Rs1]|nr:MAG: putative malonate transporter [Osedax symbiont Rs1]